MSTIKGYPGQDKSDFTSSEFVTVEPTGQASHGLGLGYSRGLFEQATDTTEAGSTDRNVTATSHGARVGDKLLFTSGTHDNVEASVIEIVDSNNLTFAPKLSSDLGAGITFSLLRPISQRLSSSGGIAVGSIKYDLDTGSGPVETTVLRDTSTPANTRALPVEIMGASGVVINVTTGDIGVQLSHSDASPDSVRIGDGVETVAVNASNEMQVADDAARTSLSTIAGAVSGSEMQVDIVSAGPIATEVTLAAINTKTPALGAALTAASTPVNIASDQIVPVSVASLPLPAGAATAALQTSGNVSLSTIAGAVAGTEMQVDVITSALPTGASTSALQTSGNTDLSTIAGAVSGSEMQVDIVTSALPTGAATEASLATVAGAVAGTEMQVDIVASLPAGTNNIGDVDVLTLPDVTQSAHDNLNANANIQVGNTDTSASNPVPTEDQLDVVDLIDDLGDGAGIVFAVNDPIDDSAGTFLTIVASLAADVKAIEVMDTTGGYIGLFTGPGASEVLKTVIGPGSDKTIRVDIASGTRLSVRRMDSATVPLTDGFLAMNFLGRT